MTRDPKTPFLSNTVKANLHNDDPNGCNYVTNLGREPVTSNWETVEHLKSHAGTTKRDAP